MTNKYHELDKQISREIMGEFKGKIVTHKCLHCNGSGKLEVGNPFLQPKLPIIDCPFCDNGVYDVEY